MNRKLKLIVDQLTETYKGIPSEFRDEVTVTVQPERVREACVFLKDQHGFDMLLDITAVDYYPERDTRFHLVYHFYSMTSNQILVLRVPLQGDEPEINTIDDIYINANWYEREIWDLMGIRFINNRDPRRILLPQDWIGHPLRKDYPLGYEEVQYTFNFDEINRTKRYPKD